MNVSSPLFMVYETLVQACSQDPASVKQAEAKLSSWETEQGFYSTIIQILVDPSLDTGARFIACVCLKNAISKYWRHNAINELRFEEKATIRAALINHFNEPVPQIAVQMAVIVAKIARWDCPTKWPELVPRLLEAMQAEDPGKQQYQAMLVFHHVVKALASRRIAADKAVFEELTQTVYQFMLNLWDGFTNLFYQSVSGGSDTEQCMRYLEKSTLALKSLRRLTIFGFKHPDKSTACMLFIRILFQRLREFLDCRLQVKGHDALKQLAEKQIVKMMKTLNELLDHHPTSCVQFIADMLEFSFYFAFNDGIMKILEDNVVTFVPFAINCIHLMKALISNTALGGNRPVTSTLSEDIRTAMTIKDEFFTQERIAYICEKLVLYYFVLTQAELEAWDEDPECYAEDEAGDNCLYALRPCAESFYLAMFNRFRPQMIAEVVKQAQMARQSMLTETSTLKEILFKDAIYNAVGLGAFNLFDDIDFNQWFTEQMVHELHLTGSDNFRIIRRRVIWLIGRWTGVKFSATLRPLVYSECLQLMRPEEDMTVRLAASAALMSTIDDFDFAAEEFEPFLESSFELLFGLLKGASECETKMNVLNIMSLIIDKVNVRIISQIDNLIKYLPLLWEESNDHNMLRCAIVVTLLRMVQAVGDVPVQLAPFLYPVIGLSTNINEPAHVYLLEDGLDLWLAVLENSAEMTPEMLVLCENILPIIEMTSEHLRTVICIMQAYIVLDPNVYLGKYGAGIVECCNYLMADMRPDGIALILKLYEAIVRALPEPGLQLLKPVLPAIFERVSEDKDYPMVMSLYLAIISRTLLISQGVFSEVLLRIQSQGRTFEQILGVWLARMPCVVNMEKKKLLGLALASMLTAQNETVYENLPAIALRLCETLNDVMKEDDETGALADSLLFSDCLEMDDSEMGDVDYRTRHAQRLKALGLKDPVYSTSLAEYLLGQLAALKLQLGPERYVGIMKTINEEDLQNLREYIDLGMPMAPQVAN